MNINYTATATEDDTITSLKRFYNRANGTSLTNREYIEGRISTFMAGLAAEEQQIISKDEILQAYSSAETTIRDQVRTLLNF